MPDAAPTTSSARFAHRGASGSIGDLVRLGLPLLEDPARLFEVEPDEGKRPPVRRPAELLIDAVVIEADGGRMMAGVGVIDSVEPSPVDRPEAHRAGLAARVDFAALQAEAVQDPTGLADRHDLGMRGRIVG